MILNKTVQIHRLPYTIITHRLYISNPLQYKGFFFLKFWPYVWLVFQSGLWMHAFGIFTCFSLQVMHLEISFYRAYLQSDFRMKFLFYMNWYLQRNLSAPLYIMKYIYLPPNIVKCESNVNSPSVVGPSQSVHNCIWILNTFPTSKFVICFKVLNKIAKRTIIDPSLKPVTLIP